ncbi:MAG: hypothetical protein C0594_13245 [Marinilabiliales bacterium]|nr:MAG: hypothetical protein C0594_13245 [Marinilabiliales bacterium]
MSQEQTKKSKAAVQPKDKTIVQHNAITMARYTMTSMEKKIIYYLLYVIGEKKELNNIIIPVSELVGKLSEDKEINYQHLRKATAKLIGRVYEIPKTTGEMLQVAIISSAEYKPREGLIEVSFDQKMKPYLLELKNNFTIFKLHQALSLSGIYSQRFYEMLSQFSDTGWWKVTVDHLRELLKLKNKYSDYNMFKKKVILSAQKEIHSHTDLRFTWEEEKIGRRIGILLFRIRKVEAEQIQIPFESELLERLQKKYYVKQKQAITILREVPIKEVNKTLYSIQLVFTDGKIEDRGAYTWSVFKSKYGL